MPSRNNTMVRRGINRLAKLIEKEAANIPALSALAETVNESAGKVNSAWRAYQNVSVKGDREREERESAIDILTGWIQNWRPVILIKVPGADLNLKTLPSKGATPDDVIRVAEDMVDFMNAEPNAASFLETAKADLGDKLENAKKETDDATYVLPDETAARDAFTEACVEANGILVRCLNIVRSAFGPNSAEYRQFIARAGKADDEAEESEEAATIK